MDSERIDYFRAAFREYLRTQDEQAFEWWRLSIVCETITPARGASAAATPSGLRDPRLLRRSFPMKDALGPWQL
jgi:hypothetical protein